MKIMSHANTALLYRNLSVAVRREMSFTDLFAVLGQDPELFPKKTTAAILLHEALKTGKSLPDAMACIPSQFPPATVELVRVAETHGQLAQTLDLLADEQTKIEQARNALRGAIAWPVTLLVVATLILGSVMTFVMPAFQELYSSFGADLPLPTRLMIGLSELFIAYWWVWAALAVAGWFANRRGLFTPLIERVLLAVPYIRNYLIRSFCFRLLNWLTPVQQAEMQVAVLAHIKATLYFPSVSDVLDELTARINSGQALGNALERLPPLPMRMAWQVQIGEKTGNPEDGISQALAASELELVSAQARLWRGVFLTLYLLVGFAVGFTVIALYLPIFSIGSAV